MKSVIKIFLTAKPKCVLSYKSEYQYFDMTLWFKSYDKEKIVKSLSLVKVSVCEDNKIKHEGLIYARNMIRIIGELKNFLMYHEPILPKSFSCGNMKAVVEYVNIPDTTDFE